MPLPHANQVDDEEHALPASRRDVTREARAVCAACRTRAGVRADKKLPGVLFCNECWSLARPALPDDELGAGD